MCLYTCICTSLWICANVKCVADALQGTISIGGKSIRFSDWTSGDCRFVCGGYCWGDWQPLPGNSDMRGAFICF